ncbi:unnamed protein product [Pleuronectes platessa]|uniref:Uncharacterized protein n=1 Tax=Pleuronectes platessa TaxID=8262 RepID=A0A9N7YZL1_PLEPL|nr:unnamed protein product [Pleuronectes platessa]
MSEELLVSSSCGKARILGLLQGEDVHRLNEQNVCRVAPADEPAAPNVAVGGDCQEEMPSTGCKCTLNAKWLPQLPPSGPTRLPKLNPSSRAAALSGSALVNKQQNKRQLVKSGPVSRCHDSSALSLDTSCTVCVLARRRNS